MPEPPRKPGDGCGFLLATCVISCLLLIANGIVVAAVYSWLSAIGPPLLRNARLTQACLFLGPVLLMFLEWSLYDRIRHWLAADRSATGDEVQRGSADSGA